MPLKTIVKVGNISNLSDARYCSGMGVDMLGFRVIEGQQGYIAPKAFQEIRGWISGPKVVAEIYGITRASQLSPVIENYAPDLFEMTLEEFKSFGSGLSKPAIIRAANAKELETLDGDIAYAIVDERGKSDIPLLIKPVSIQQLERDLDEGAIQGVVLDGSAEERPGFKDYAELADILEFLDEN